ncbi:IS481 family transposase [Uliginosibacterium sp. H1]|uniref:IS481 family transposase n=1 Tax=Uliginosibacterium sp. H1 TaxID=3114757 RepID=UPI002E191B7E|nr:IS481 family transposase [Uliginosibacterium sp. H1]
MPWKERDAMSLRREFIALALQPDSNRRELCRRFGISPKCAYKWLSRFAQSSEAGLEPHSRRPLSSPARSAPDLESAVVAVRQAHPCWGGRKISRRLLDTQGLTVAPSTVTEILHRHQLLGANPAAVAPPWQRFEHAAPNDLWQIDFKGHFETSTGRCHPLTLIDDHSRFNLLLEACSRTAFAHIQPHLIRIFRRYGLPVCLNADNSSPWGTPSLPATALSTMTVWLVRLGVRISHSRPYHPQTNGKDERFHRSFGAEVLAGRSFESLAQAQHAFDRWRTVYNHERPHDALGLATPDTRYRPSPRRYPEQLPPIEYGPDDVVCVPKENGHFRWRGRLFKVSNALMGLPSALRPRTHEDGVFEVFFCHHPCGQIDLNDADC